MGDIRHDMVFITVRGFSLTPEWVEQEGCNGPTLADIENFRDSLPEEWSQLVVGPLRSLFNDYVTFAFMPDGSKENRAASDQGDEYRARFVALFDKSEDIVHVNYGGFDQGPPQILLAPESENSCPGKTICVRSTHW